MIAILIGYVVIVVFYWTKSRSVHFMLIGQSIWFLLLAYVCTFFGALQVPAFIGAILYSAIGFAYNWKYVDEANGDTDSMSDTRNLSIVEKCAHFWDSPILKSTPTRPIVSNIPSSVQSVSTPVTSSNADNPATLLKNKMDLNVKTELKSTPSRPIIANMPSSVQSISSPTAANIDNPATVLKNKMELNVKTELQFKQALDAAADNDQSAHSQSAIYFKVLFLVSIVTVLYRQLFVLALCFIPIAVYLANKAIVTFGLTEWLQNQWNDLYLRIQVNEILFFAFKSSPSIRSETSMNNYLFLFLFVTIVTGLDCGETSSPVTTLLTRCHQNQ